LTEVLQAYHTKFERNTPGSLVTDTTGSTDMMKHAFPNHIFRNLPQNETLLPLSSTTRRIRDRSVKHVTYPRALTDQYWAERHWWTKPTLLAGDLTRLSLCGTQLPHALPWELELMPDTRSPRMINRHKIKHCFWRARISRALLGLQCRSQWPRSRRRGPSAARLLGL